MAHTRYAIYFVPADGPLARFGAEWLGWDIAKAADVPQPDVPGIAKATDAPRRYGFHATLKPPFRLAPGTTRDGLETAIAHLARGLAPAACEGLEPSALGRFLALTLRGDPSAINHIAAACVTRLDGFRAPPDMAELARRRNARLSDRQEALLLQWGYPHVLDQFRFHMTLTSRLPRSEMSAWHAALRETIPSLPTPFVLDRVALVGERPDGRFEQLRSFALTGRGDA